MVYYMATLREVIGQYKNEHDILVRTDEEYDTRLISHILAIEERGSSCDDWDARTPGYWFDEGVVFLPAVWQINKPHFNRVVEFYGVIDIENTKAIFYKHALGDLV